MLAEIRETRQVPGEPRRRWFTDPYFDLIVWFGEQGTVTGFQLCYDKGSDERALTWRRDAGYTHERVDDGEVPGRAKMTPILVPDGLFDMKAIAARFAREAARIDPEIAELVYARLLEFPGGR